MLETAKWLRAFVAHQDGSAPTPTAHSPLTPAEGIQHLWSPQSLALTCIYPYTDRYTSTHNLKKNNKNKMMQNPTPKTPEQIFMCVTMPLSN